MAIDSLLFKGLSSATDSIAAHVVASSNDLVDRSALYDWVDKFIDMGISIGSKMLIAALIYFCGSWIIRRIKKLLASVLERHKAEASLRTFLQSLLSVILNILLILTVVSVLGINVTSFMALFGAAGVAIGLALSNTLQNFANGVIILLLKPFKVGDYLSVQGESGTVTAIQITSTEILTNDYRTVIIPNGTLLSGVIQNYSRMGTRRVDMTFSIAYGDDFDKAREVLREICGSDPRILPDPAPFIVLGALSESAVDLTVRVFVQSKDYWDVYFALNEKVYKKFTEHGLSIPFRQIDVHMV